MIKYTILMLTHNRMEQVEACLISLSPTLKREDVRFVALDNHSAIDTVLVLDMCMDHYAKPSDEADFSYVNLGVAGGRKKLLEQAVGEYVVFLDSDTQIVDPHWLDTLGKVLDDNENIGMVGPGGSFVKADWSGFTAAQPNAECDCVAGFCQMFRRSLLDLGVAIDMAFDKFWAEDSDFCMQIRDKGWDVYCQPVGVMHYPAHSGYGQEPGLHDAHIKLFREKWQGKGLTKAEGAY